MTHTIYVIHESTPGEYGSTKHYYAVPVDPDDTTGGVLHYGGRSYHLVAHVSVVDSATYVEVKGFGDTYRWLPWNRVARIDSYEIDELVFPDERGSEDVDTGTYL